MKALLASLAAVVMSAAPSLAMTQQERNDHIQIVEAVDAVNIQVLVNDYEWCGNGERFLGAYVPGDRKLIICQENAKVWDGEPIYFTEEDLDTLRHEAHHLAQDCLDGSIDGRLSLLFESYESKMKFRRMMDPRIEPKVRRVYGEAGASAHVIELEIEAFGVAAEVEAQTIATAVTKVCGAGV